MPQKERSTLVDRLSTALVSSGLVTKEQLSEAKRVQERTGQSLGKVLVDLNFLSQEKLIAFVARQLEIPDVDLSSYIIDSKLIDLVPEDIARKNRLIPLFKVRDTITVAMANPIDVFALDDLRLQIGLEVKPALASEESIDKALNEYYGATHAIDEAAGKIGRGGLELDASEAVSVAKLERIIEQPPIVRLVNEVIIEALKQGASDIHLEPQKRDVRVRYRIDGILHTISAIPKHLALPVVSRIKIMANLDIAERRMPQDGRIFIKVGEKDIDLRASTFFTINGEKVMLRILDRSALSFDLPSLGFSSENLVRLQNIIKRPGGIVFVCGPTGCGKTTTLYSILNVLNSQERNIVTLENPVEYVFEGINQGPIYPKRGLTFTSGLRTILRQDPDIVMVGEVRDFETAELAIRAALTGHLVFSTLHTMDAAGTLTRLIDMGVEPYLLASSIRAVVAQRLVRCICKNCKTEYTPEPEMLESLSLPAREKTKYYKGEGCIECRHTGYKGRTGIFELMTISREIRGLILAKASADAIREASAEAGFRSLEQDGLDKVLAGVTTIEEVLRVTKSED